MSNKKVGFVSFFGRPNVGKSTLLNQILGLKVSITSPRAQTTRNQINGIYNDDDSQIVFIDTPGVHKPLHQLGDRLNKDAYSGLITGDVILFVVDVTASFGRGDDYVLDKLKNVSEGIPVFLILNKVDLINRAQLAPLLVEWSNRYNFDEIFPVSAKDGINVKQLISSIKKYLHEGPMYYDEDEYTNVSERFMVAETIREKVLRLTLEEVPHSVAVLIEKMEFSKGHCEIDATIIVDKDTQKGIIIGRRGAMLTKIGTYAREDIEKLLNVKVTLNLFVRVEEGWRNKNKYLTEFGYGDKK